MRSVRPQERSGRLLRAGNLLLEKSGGGDLQPVGVVVSYDLPESAVCSNFVSRITVAKGFDSRFVCYLHAGLYAADVNSRSIKQNTGIQNLDSNAYFTEPIAFPPPDEQRAIAAFLDRETAKIDSLLAKKERLIALLEEKLTSLVTRAVTRGLDPSVPLKESGVDWVRDVPATWRVRRNRLLFRERDARSIAGEEELLTVSHITGVTRRSEKNVNMIEAESHEGYKLCEPGDLVINTMWAWMGALGIAREVGMVSPAYNVYRIVDSGLLPEYLEFLCRTPAYVCELTRFSKGVWKSRLRLYPEDFMEISTIVPSAGEQRSIAAYLTSEVGGLDALLSKIREAIDKLREYRTALISAAVTGKIDVVEPVKS